MSVAIHGTNGVTFNDGTVQPSAAVGKNLIINGDMRINQRGNYSTTVNSTSVTPAVDRWLGRGKGSAGVFNILATAENSNGFNNHVVLDVTTASTPSGTDSYRFQQMIEGYNIARLNWGTASAKSITLSFWVKSTLTGTFGGSVANGDYNRFNPFSYTISAANTWEYKTVTIAGDTSGTWNTTNGLGMRLNFSLGAGSDRLGTAGTWTSSVLEGVTGQTNHIATNSSNLRITGVQVEEGTSATDFEHLQFGQQLALCQRYYQVHDQSVNAYYNAGIVGFPFNTVMRASPTLSLSYSGTANRVYRLDTGATADLTISGSTMTTTGFNHLYAFTPSGWASAAGVGFRSTFVFSAEL
nr:hypothetical protein MEP433_gp42 [Methylophilales phage MEP433]WOZ55723.1 hypothetical protein MEP434_gp41 [Methylophilales phage MEP434]